MALSNKKTFILTLLFLGLIQASLADTNITCDIFKVQSGETPTNCVNPDKNDTSTFYNLQQCTDDKICPFNSQFKNNHTVTCQPKVNPLVRYFPGQSCSSDNECYTQLCKNGVCNGIEENKTCEFPHECYHGFSCINVTDSSGKPTAESTCQQQRNEGEKCVYDTDCINTHGCLGNVCVAYFSVPNNQNLATGESNFYTSSGYSFCASGFSLNNKCYSATNQKDIKTNDCGTNTECTYTLSDNTTASIPKSCECTFHADGLKRCKLDTTSDVYTQFVNHTKTALGSLRHCYSDERTVNCKGYTKKPYVKDYEMINEWKYLKWLKENGHKVALLSDAEARTVFNVTSADILTNVQPQPNPTPEQNPDPSEIHKCPAFQCKKDNATPQCAYFSNADTSNWFNSTAVLNNVCNKDQVCGLNIDDPLFWLTNRRRNATCVDSKHIITNKRYPGEDCDASNPNITCYSGTCGNDKVCSGAKQGEPCDVTEECWIGNFCFKNGTDPGVKGVCTPQRDVKEPCFDKYDCKNNLLCHNSICVNMFSLDDGTTVLSVDSDKSHFCKSGRANDKSKCVKRTINMKKDTSDITAKCTPGTTCQYLEFDGVNNNTVTEKCACGFNANRQAYCPLDDVTRVDQWNDHRSSIAKSFDNKCHSMSRDDCYKNDQNVFQRRRTTENNSRNYHLFIDSVDCAKDMFASSSFVKMSLFALFGLIAALLF